MASMATTLVLLLTVIFVQQASTGVEVCNKHDIYCLPNGVQYTRCVNGTAGIHINDCPTNTSCNTDCQSSSPCCPVSCTVNTTLPFLGDSSRYHTCTVDGNGTATVTDGTCPPGYRFDAVSHKCETSFVCATSGYFPNPVDCAKYHVCIQSVEGPYLKMDLNCEEGAFFQEETTICVHNASVCEGRVLYPPISVGEPVYTETFSVHPDCINKGGSEKWEDEVNCSYFYTCVWREGNVVPKKYRCLNPAVYDPEHQRCSRKYKCTKPQTADNNDTVPGWSSEFS